MVGCASVAARRSLTPNRWAPRARGGKTKSKLPRPGGSAPPGRASLHAWVHHPMRDGAPPSRAGSSPRGGLPPTAGAGPPSSQAGPVPQGRRSPARGSRPRAVCAGGGRWRAWPGSALPPAPGRGRAVLRRTGHRRRGASPGARGAGGRRRERLPRQQAGSRRVARAWRCLALRGTQAGGTSRRTPVPQPAPNKRLHLTPGSGDPLWHALCCHAPRCR